MNKEIIEELCNILDDMDIPDGVISQIRLGDNMWRNIPWLIRNMQIRNSKHPNFNTANSILKSILMEMKN